MAVDINTTNNITYEWWCLKCQCYHYFSYCPQDIDGSIHSPLIYDYCPHCGQIINKDN